MTKQKLIELLFKRAEGLLSLEEAARLETWLAASPDHRVTEKKVEEILGGLAKPDTELELDLDEEYLRLSQRIQKSKEGAQRFSRSWQIFGVAAAMAILVLAVWFVNRIGSPKDLVISDDPAGAVLPDQSRVWLSKGSSATFREAEDGREVQLNGVAYFEVSRDERRPFRVETAQGLVEVIGTRFEVEARQVDSLRVAVSEGIVKVYNQTRSDSMTLRANEEMLIHGQNLERLEARLQPLAVWRMDPILFSRTPLAEIFAEVEEVYGVTFRVENEQVLNCIVTFTLTYPTMPVLIQTLETLLSVKITEEGERQYLVSGEGC